MAHATISRLDQVFTLLENGGSSITRKAAAKQLGDVQKRYPHELNNLLAKLVSYIRNAEWGTRVAAVEAFEAVIEQVPKWNSEPNPNVDNQKGGDTESVDLECKTQLTFSDFDIDKLLDCSEVLLSSSGDEFKLTRAQQNGDGKMLAVNQRKFLEKSLGLNVAGNVGIGVSSNDLFKDEDLEDKELTEMKTEVDACNKKPCEVVMSEMLQLQHMSSRERNRAKRKAKLLMKQQSREGYSKGTNLNEQPAKKKKMAGDAVKTEAEAICFDAIPKHSNNPRDWVHWPMRWIYNELLDLLFNSVWESRHGACMALRILIKIHGNACGKTVDASTQQSSSQHQKCLIDLSIRLLSVITLDRFADFVSDQVVAPVRESCAQTLSIVTSYLDPAHVFSVIDVLLHLHTKEEWELRQSAMLAVQYIIAVRQDLLDSILPRCLPAITRGLQDKDGDVKSVAAKALLPATTLLVSHFATHVDELLALLWNSLREYDELTASTHSIMLLLSKLINALPPDRICGHKDAESLSSRLLPFFQHVEASVREAAVSTFSTLLSAVVPAQESVPWREETCVRVLSNIFESCAVERNPRVQQLSVETFLACVRGFACEPVLSCGRDYFRAWMMITCQHCHVSFDLSTLQHRHSVDRGAEGDEQKFIGGCFPSSHPPSNADCHVMKTRQQLAGMLGAVCWHSSRFAGDHVTNMQQLLLAFLASQSAMQQMVAAMVVRGFWKEAGERCGDEKNALSLQIRAALEKSLEQGVYFAEIAPQFMQLQTDMRALLTSARQLGVVVAADFAAKPVFSVLEIIEFCTELTSTTATDFKPAAESRLQVQRELVRRAAQRVHGAQRTWSDHVKSHAAGAVVLAASLARDDVTVTSSAWQLPPKLNSIIRPLMDTLKRERNEAVVERAVDSIAMLVGMCSDRSPSPTHKLVRNLISSLAALPARCPTHLHTLFSESVLSSCQVNAETVATDGIVTLLRQRSNSASEGWRRGKCDSTREDQSSADLTSLDVETASRNAESCIRRVCQTHTSHLFQVAPKLRELIYGIKPRDESGVGSEDAACISDDVTSLCHGLLTLEIVSSALESHPPVNQMLSGLLPFVVRNLSHQLSSVRFVAAHCLASLATHSPTTVMPVIIHEVLGEIESEDLTQRRGSIEALANVVEALGPDVVAYSVLLVVPLLGRMSDHEAQIRLLATSTFAQLIQYIPIESSVPDPPDMSVELTEKKDRDRRFLDQLFDSSSLEAYHVPITIRTTLRSYQEDGVKWLAFLNRYKLHGILCDDMGLGKTLQTICIVASDHFYKRQQIEEKAEASAQQQKHHLVSLVICPPTLTGHWVEEVSQFCDHLTPLHYVGTPPERTRLQANLRSHNLVIASYEVVRNDIHFFSAVKWNYCVLDEGHVIRNGKSKLSQCVKSLLANHRLILTGTPIQNNVLELWSLFDFLLPGFLGTEQEFSVRFTKPILASRDAKSTSREQEEGVLAMQALHRQVLPFMLRRMKEDVLKDLPPKIIQDYYCDLSQLQLELYDDFAKSKAKKVAESTIKSTCGDDDDADRATSKGTSHVFQALQYLQKVCNHPAFVLTPGHPHYTRITDKLCAAKQSIHDVKHASKLVALQQLLLDCGIGTGASQHGELQAVVSHHRALIFCQHRTMLDVIQNHLLHQHMPSVTYLRLDGQVPTNLRFSTVSRFNNDPSIDVLLLTTKVGGLGLNLTGADTVIFVEHDWNPMIDLQAMDRAHRIGQKKVVNVYRLITRGTLEEKILGLQKFKLKMARTIVSEDNRALHSMDTGQVLDLFNVNSTPRKWDGKGDNQQQQQLADSLSSPSRGLKAMMDGLSDLWDQNQYDEQYNLDTFLKSLS